ncbi:MAG: hypothetical protein GXO23_01340 [Crenarchaeota archaeon]|nr:hypothetical protein [Thermoproteota archaeon]
MSLRERARELIRDRKSVLCISIDPALPGSREKYTIPERYLTGRDEENAILEFTLDIIDRTFEKVVAYKLNLWYISKLSAKNQKYIANYINRLGNISILDCKINDITDTVEIGIKNIADTGYRAVTINPLLGNLKNIVQQCKKEDIGSLVLTLTSNREAEKYLKRCLINGEPMYITISRDIVEADADGCVVGLTGIVGSEDIRTIRSIVGEERILFLVGVGAQGGDISKIESALPGLVLVNVGRDVIYSEDPLEKVNNYNAMLSRFLEKVSVI